MCTYNTTVLQLLSYILVISILHNSKALNVRRLEVHIYTSWSASTVYCAHTLPWSLWSIVYWRWWHVTWVLWDVRQVQAVYDKWSTRVVYHLSTSTSYQLHVSRLLCTTASSMTPMPQSHPSGDTTVSINYNIVNTRVTRLERREISVQLTSRKERTHTYPRWV